LVPSPNVAEDHQTKNAMSLVERNAALLVKDEDAYDELIPEAITLLSDGLLQNQLATEIKKLEKPDAVVSIVDVCEQIIRRRRKK
jgi:UDP-N-acetylglucosamine--N-acetylmuramyl-(pentapeptide) pyrophosphoryl-undecaprenol N-acetylglucosamine transferase